jgi:hypothetical protein
MSRFRRAILSRIERIEPSAWDYEWDVSKGHLDANNYTLSGVNSYGGRLSYTNDGALFNVDNFQNVTVTFNTLASNETVFESTFNIERLGSAGFNFYISNGTDTCHVQFINTSNDWKMGVQTTQYGFAFATGLESNLHNVDCTLKIEFVANGKKKVYLNDVLFFDDTTYQTSDTNRIWIRYDNKVLIKSLKWKL